MIKVTPWSMMIPALLLSFTSHSQGCSDAGFCSAGSLNTHNSSQGIYDSPQHWVGLSASYGRGDRQTNIFTPQVEAGYALGKSIVLEIKLPYVIASAVIGHNAGVGDPVLTATKMVLPNTGSWSFAVTAGARFGLSDANAHSVEGHSLPMPLQASLGTTDIIAGVAASWHSRITIAAGIQEPVIDYNHNDFIQGSMDEAAHYFTSERLRRAGDALLRLDAHLTKKSWKFSAGPLAIYHLHDDHGGPDIQDYTIEGSKGLTLNITGSVAFSLENFRFDISAGTPLITRKTRPDGLTREWVVTPRAIYRIHR